MTAGDRKFAAFASLVVTVSVAANMIAFQDKGQGSAIETGGLGSRAVIVGEAPALTTTGAAATAVVPVNLQASVAAPTPEAPVASEAPDVNLVEITRGVQRELNARGYNAGPSDGAAGLVTRAAIFAYEYDNGLVLTGQPSEPLLTQIVLGSSSLSANSARPGKTISAEGEALVRTVKQQLSALGYQTGTAGTGLTPELARAIREFETDQKLTASGRISGPLMSRLIRIQSGSKSPRNAVARTTSR